MLVGGSEWGSAATVSSNMSEVAIRTRQKDLDTLGSQIVRSAAVSTKPMGVQ